MNDTDERLSKPIKKGGKVMEFLIPFALLGAWFILQAWVLPRFGVKT